MRAFMILCLVALATADKLGYNYRPVDHGDDNYGRGESNLSEQIAQGGHSGGGVSGGNGGGFGGGVGGGNGGGFGGGDQGYEKEFYTFSANDEEFDSGDGSQDFANSLKQNLRVIFIKGPENHALEHAALNLAKHASEQRTAIYVLNKQADIGALAHKLNTENSHNQNRPEVHFVKYRTPEDAHNAQQQIQSQYDNLGGSSTNVDGGVAPVIDFSSAGHNGGHGHGGHGGHAGHGGHGGNGGFGAGTAPQGTYLPPAFFRL